MSIAEQYLSLAQYAEKRGSSEPTLKKLMDAAEGTQYDIGAPEAEYGGTRIWHIAKWRQLELFRLTNAINEAIELGFVVTMDTAAKMAADEWNGGYAEGYAHGLAKGHDQGINHVATGSWEGSDPEFFNNDDDE